MNNSGMPLAKLLEASRLFDEARQDNYWIVIQPPQWDILKKAIARADWYDAYRLHRVAARFPTP